MHSTAPSPLPGPPAAAGCRRTSRYLGVTAHAPRPRVEREEERGEERKCRGKGGDEGGWDKARIAIKKSGGVQEGGKDGKSERGKAGRQGGKEGWRGGTEGKKKTFKILSKQDEMDREGGAGPQEEGLVEGLGKYGRLGRRGRETGASCSI